MAWSPEDHPVSPIRHQFLLAGFDVSHPPESYGWILRRAMSATDAELSGADIL